MTGKTVNLPFVDLNEKISNESVTKKITKFTKLQINFRDKLIL